MEPESNLNMKNEKKNLTLIYKYYDQAKTKLQFQYHVDQFGKEQGEEKWWHENEQVEMIVNYKDGRPHGKFQSWLEDGERLIIDNNHQKKGIGHGTRIEFRYE